MQFPIIRIFEQASWDHKAAELVHAQVYKVLRRRGHCNVVLTGGGSARRMYAAWSRVFDISLLKNVSFYFGDERCVPPDHLESNFRMAVDHLFGDGIPSGCSVHRIEAESADLEAAASRYAAVLPKSIDILLLGVGEDGHIASLFPHAMALHEKRRLVLPVIGPKQPYQRLTITPPVIRQAHLTVVLAAGAKRAAVLEEALRIPNEIDALPACLVVSGIWLLDRPLKGFIDHAVYN